MIIEVVYHIQRISCQPGKTTSYGGQSRAWSPEQGKYNKKTVAPPPPPSSPTLLVINKLVLIGEQTYESLDASTGATQVSVGLAYVQGSLRLVD